MSRTDVDAGAMALDARQVALRRPAAVAVHDDGHVRGEPVGIIWRASAWSAIPEESTPVADQATWAKSRCYIQSGKPWGIVRSARRHWTGP